MAALYVISSEKGSGKTALCAGLAKQLTTRGKKIGFFKPVINAAAAGNDSDAAFMKQLFSLAEPVDLLCPAIQGGSRLVSNIKEAYARVAQGKDVVIVEGPSEQYQTASEVATVLNAKVIMIEAYSKALFKAADSYKRFGQSLLGVVINKVPRTRLEGTKTLASKAGVNVLGIIPEDRALLAITIGELAEYIHGEFLSGAKQSAELVENLMLGALGLDPGPEYFGRKANKAVILKSERPDMQLAALQTSSRCLVLAGSTPPKPAVISDAEARHIPIILAKDSVPAVVANIEGAVVKARFNQLNKLPRLTEIIEQNFNLKTLYQGLGI